MNTPAAAAAHPARVVDLVVSDILGDALCDIASGLTIPAEQRQYAHKADSSRYRRKIADIGNCTLG